MSHRRVTVKIPQVGGGAEFKNGGHIENAAREPPMRSLPAIDELAALAAAEG